VLAACESAQQLLRQNLPEAARQIEAALADARRLRHPSALAEASRLKAHVEYLSGRYGRASQQYRRAIHHARRAGDVLALARTLSSALQTLVYLGRYDEAATWAEEARLVFQQHGDALRLARLESNLANVLHRQDRAEEALPLYESAIAGLNRAGDNDNAVIALRNLAVCAMALHDFPRALAAYEQAGRYYEQRGAKSLLAEVTDNLAYLHYLRGDYRKALALYQSAREQASERPNPFYQAVAELDQSDLYLDLNLHREAARTATDAYGRFTKVGTRFEAAKSLANRAAAHGGVGETAAALADLAAARRLFLKERNRQWAAVTEVRRASILLLEERWRAAASVAARAESRLTAASLASHAALSALIQTRAELELGHASQALHHARRVRRYLNSAPNPLLETRLLQTEGAIQESLGRPVPALRAYRRAHITIRDARHGLPHDHLRLAYLGDKLATYEALVSLTLKQGGRDAATTAFGFVEEAKSRSLADQLAFRAAIPVAATPERQVFVEAGHVAGLRADLAWHWHQLDRADSSREPVAEARRLSILARIRDLEGDLSVALNTLRRVNPELADLQGQGELPLAEIQAAMAEGTALWQYFLARGRLMLFVVSRWDLQAIDLGPIEPIRTAARMARFQLSRGSAGPAQQAALRHHLHRLHELLLAPAQHLIPSDHITVIPDGELHGLPFHAFEVDGRPLLERCLVTYSLSASVHHRTKLRPPGTPGAPLVLGVPDPLAPHIETEVRLIAGILPEARTFLGSAASSAALRRHAPGSRWIHLATHGIFREDNPMFSSIRLGDGRLNVSDLYDLDLQAELVTLSGCFTGMGALVGGNEFVGLSRGFLHAGARRLHVSLWAVDDLSAPRYMRRFYEYLNRGSAPAEAWRNSALAFREEDGHPARWANFILMQ
jgi:CHAT domain-containing protein/tetratricopeptide (TPR) repeat protein